jgi:ribosomal 50S subunit-associated protein YjgA (DUF615 family)
MLEKEIEEERSKRSKSEMRRRLLEMSKLSSRSMSLNNSIKKLGMNNSYCCR